MQLGNEDEKLTKLKEERQHVDTTLIESLNLDIGNENSRKEL